MTREEPEPELRAAAYREERSQRENLEHQQRADAFAVTVDGELELLCHSANDAIAQRDAWRHDQPNDIQAVAVSIAVLRTLEHDDA